MITTDAVMHVIRVQREEKIALAGIIVALFADDPGEADRRLGVVEESLIEYRRTLPRGSEGRSGRATCEQMKAIVSELRPLIAQVSARAQEGAAARDTP